MNGFIKRGLLYDIIGDIHGHAKALEALLQKLGYRELGGVWSHPERQVIFLGDFIDRGPEQLRAVEIPRRMVEAGHALAVMGNHEFNAVLYATPDPKDGGYLREHSEKNREQHQEFLQAVGEGSALHRELIDWFGSLPVYLDLPALRVVHACWHEPSMKALAPWLDNRQRLLPDTWLPAARKGHEVFSAIEALLKGLEIALPAGVTFRDKGGHHREHARTRWWQDGQPTWQETAMVPPEAVEGLPKEQIPPDQLPGYDGSKPLFLGHYWLTDAVPEPLTKHIACLDYSVAAKKGNGKLVAYRWEGESVLRAEGFVWV
ncbi:MAG: metallophosphoesterase [Pseudohongiellaceae bacterium]